jgi:hypothetical protein
MTSRYRNAAANRMGRRLFDLANGDRLDSSETTEAPLLRCFSQAL